MRHKSILTPVLDAEIEGAFRAKFATFNVIDKDADYTLPGSMPVGKRILISAYQHTTWYGSKPVGIGTIAADDNEAWVDGQFWLDTTDGLETYKVVKNAAELQEWSYGYDILDASTNPAELAALPEQGAQQILKGLDVYEVSPVFLGAGITGTEFIKSMGEPYADQAERTLTFVKAWVERSRELASLRAKDGRVLSSANRERLSALLDALSSASSDISDLLAATEPSSDANKAKQGEDMLAIVADYQRRQALILSA